MAPFSYARRAILWHHNMVPFNGVILWHVCTLYLALDFCHNVKICRPMYNMHPHISTKEVSISAKNGHKRASVSHCVTGIVTGIALTTVVRYGVACNG